MKRLLNKAYEDIEFNMSMSDRKAGWAVALHTAEQDLISGISFGPLTPTEVIPEH